VAIETLETKKTKVRKKKLKIVKEKS
jgi:hypothetical protein